MGFRKNSMTMKRTIIARPCVIESAELLDAMKRLRGRSATMLFHVIPAIRVHSGLPPVRLCPCRVTKKGASFLDAPFFMLRMIRERTCNQQSG